MYKWKVVLVVSCLLVSPALFAQDPNIEAAGDAGPPVQADPVVSAGSVVAWFPGPQSTLTINLSIRNDTTFEVGSFVLDSESCTITWDDMGSFSGPATLDNLSGVDTEVVTMTFSGFEPGETVKFSGIDPDITGSPSSGVTPADIIGCVARVGSGFALFAEVGGDTVAVVEPLIKVDVPSTGAWALALLALALLLVSLSALRRQASRAAH